MRKIGYVDVSRLKRQIDVHPELWNKFKMRTTMFKDSVHRDVQDIWLRYNAWENFDPFDPCAFANEHVSVNYPAWDDLPAAGDIINSLLNEGDELGGCLITKIPANCEVKPHEDHGWHAEYYDTKILVLVESNELQTFNFENSCHSGYPGEVHEFNNQAMHSVINGSDIDRVSLIAAVRRKPKE